MPIEYNPSISFKGLNTDFKIDSLSEGEYPYALNAVSRDNLQFLTNDLSNDLCVELEGNIIGSLYIEYNIFILFLDNNTIIRLNTDTCSYEVLLNLDCLNFNINNQIQAAYTALNDCNQKIIYWTDFNNVIRYYNIDSDELITDCNQLSLMNCNIIPVFNNVQVLNTGGQIRTGTYQFAASLGTSVDNNSPLYTNWYFINNPISIFDDSLTDPFWRIDGAAAGTLTNKSIKLTISNLPARYNLMKIAVIQTIDQIVNVKLISTLNYTENNLIFVYNGDSEQDIDIPLAEIIVTKASYLKAKDLVIKDNRLILGNLTTVKNINYQKYANNIKVNYFTEKIRIDVYPYAYKNPSYTYSHKSWMRDEAYSLAIVWEFCDGSFSRAFHLPGRPMQCFDYRVDDNNNQVDTDIEGNPLCDDFILENDANIIDCDLVKWKNRNTAIRTNFTGCYGTIPLNTPLFDISESGICSGCVTYGEDVPCSDEGCLGNCDTSICNSTAWGSQGSCPDGQVEAFTNYLPEYYIYTLPFVDLSASGWTIAEETATYIKWTGCYNSDSLLPITQDCDVLYLENCVYSEGELAYHQSCERYPLIKDCNGEYMYPTETDELGNIVGQYIRHHRMPDSTTEPHYTVGGTNLAYVEPKETENIATVGTPYMDTYVYPVGLNFTNIQPPDDIAPEMIKGFRIVYVERTITNKSVVAKGILHGTMMDDDKNNALYVIPKHAVNSYEYWSYPGGGAQHVEPFYSTALDKRIIGAYTFMSPDTSYTLPELGGDYIKIDWEFYGRGDVYGDRDDWDNEDFCDDAQSWGRRQNININQKTISKNPDPNNNNFQINRKLKGLMYAYGNMFTENISTITYPLDNRWRESSVYLELENDKLDDHLRLVNNYPDFEGTPFTGFLGNDVLNDSDTSFWKTEFILNLPSPDGNPPRERLNKMGSSAAHYVAIKRNICDQYGRVETSLYIDTGLRRSINNIDVNQKYEIKGIYGDSFINYWSYRRTSRLSTADYDGTNQNEYYDGEEFQPKTLKTLIHCVVESDVNVDLRHEGELLKDAYYPKLKNKTFNLDSAVPNSAKPLNSYLNRFWYNECTKEVEDWLDNSFNYNIDYSNVNNKFIYVPVTITYKTCDCVNELQNTIAYSNKSNLNNFNYNDFLEDNFLTVPSLYGPINNLLVLNNTLYAHTRDIIWKVFSNEKQLKIDDTTVYLGQGDLFNKDPLAVYAAESGYAGNILLHGTMSTENGYYFYDLHGGKIHHLTDKLDDLSLKKMSNFFKENSKFCISNIITNLDNYANPDGIGIMFAFDYFNNRLLLSKKDYEFVDETIFGGVYQENDCVVGNIYYHEGKFVLIEDTDCSYSILSLKNTDYFCDKSFTLSYSYNLDGWVSFHSFIPDYYIFDRKNFYTVLDKKIYSHNKKCSYLNYYNNIYPYILEFPLISKPNVIVDTLSSLHWNSFAYEADLFCNETFKNNITFNKLLIYNSMQSTGQMDLIFNKGGYLRKEPTYPAIHVDRNERHFSVNNLRDYVINYDLPMFINNCDSNCSTTVNKLFNNAKIDINKYYKQLQRLRDSYHIARFSLENTDNVKLVIDYLITTNKNSNR
ncbi:MAG TPA: hypothetical protein PKD00_02485 [Burkholderiales bacterium]|nr:hypothetical protein [Burkholderiales bacterium]